MKRGTTSEATRSSLALVGLVGLVAPARSADAQTLRTVISDALRGGVTVDGWGIAGSEVALSRGEFHLRMPGGSRVRRAILVSATMSPTADMPPGPAGNPRVVVLGSGAGMVTHPLEGTPTYSVRSPTYGFFWGTWSRDVTMAIQLILNAGSPIGGALNVPIAERGDRSASFPNYPYILGHTLVVEYEHDAAPLRNVVMYEGAANTGFMTMIPLPLPAPVANNCPAASPRSEPFAASLGVHFEWNVNEEDQPVRVNGMLVTSTAGGCDDSDSPSTAAGLIFSGLTTTGSFGGSDATMTLALGAPVGLENDVVLGPPVLPAGRRDDELYDFRTIIADGATSLTFAYSTPGVQDDQMVGTLVIQTLARDAMGDADRDGHSDAVEGNCTIDSDNDGTPDYLDTDSDNDCLPDLRESAMGRTMAMVPGAPDDNCMGLTCDRTIGVCACTRPGQCRNPEPICLPFSRTCARCGDNADCAMASMTAPICVAAGAQAGWCLECNSSADCPPARGTCDTMTHRCTDPDTDMDGLSDGVERRLGTNPMMRDSDGDGIDDGAEVGDPMMPRDTDRDGQIDAIDNDDDGDGIPTARERELDPSMDDDLDMDGIPSHRDTDSDGDGDSDRDEAGRDPGAPVNTDGAMDGPDFLDRDSDNDCAPDSAMSEDGAARTARAMNPNAHCVTPGEVCELSSGRCVAGPAPDGGADGSFAGDGGVTMDAASDPDAGSPAMDAPVASNGDSGGRAIDGTGGAPGMNAGGCGCRVPVRSTDLRGGNACVLLSGLGLACAVRRRRNASRLRRRGGIG